MDTGNEQVMRFCEKCRLIELMKEADELMSRLDVTYEEVKGWDEI